MTTSGVWEQPDGLIERGLELLRTGARASDRKRDALLAQQERLRRRLLEIAARRLRQGEAPAGRTGSE
ncbi:MAG: hypothetical protein WEB06_13690 [Actinomycetota bacterium]